MIKSWMAVMFLLGAYAVEPAAEQPDRNAEVSSVHENAMQESEVHEVLYLKYASCFEMLQFIEEAVAPAGGRVQPIERLNALLYVGPVEQLDLAQGLIKQLDVQADAGAQENDLIMVPVRHRNPEELARSLNQSLRSNELGIAADIGRSMIVLKGPSRLLEMGQSVLSQLDQPASTANLEFVYFRAFTSQQEKQVPIPEDLADVAKELKRFGSIEMIGRLTTVAVEDEAFSLSGIVAGGVSVESEGRLDSAPDQGSVKLRVKSRLNMLQMGLGGEPVKGPMPEFRVETSISMARGDYVVLGSAPSGWATGESAILVLHVLPE